MNVILVLIDSLNKQALRAYAPTPIHSPNLEQFAASAFRFDNHFVGSLPCMPARREIFTGRKEMLWRPWGPLEPFDLRLGMLLEQNGYKTALITDHYHYWEEEANGYPQCFQSTEFIRGHEMDLWQGMLMGDEPVPQWVHNIDRWRPGWGRRYYANVKGFKGQEDFFPAKVFGTAARWLEENAGRKPFFLQVESFDVHEPFDVPEPYASMYGDGPAREQFTLWPPYQLKDIQDQFLAQASPQELAFIRAQYAGKLTMVDHWFGHLQQTIGRLGLWEDTVVIVTTDHGHDLAERGDFGKQYPHYDSHANIPLMIRHPAHPAQKTSVSSLTSTVDLFATILDVAGVEAERTHSQSMVPLLSEPGQGREALLYGTFGEGVVCTDGEWTLIKSPVDNQKLFAYSPLMYRSLTERSLHQTLPVDQGHFIPGIKLPQWKIPVSHIPRNSENYLFNRLNDPRQQQNLWDSQPDERKRMLKLLSQLMLQEGSPPEQFDRLGIAQ